MGTNGNGQFRDDELVHRKVKVGNEWQTRTFFVVGGRVRILHESNDRLSIQTEIVKLDLDFVVVRAPVENQSGKFNGTGTASAQRDGEICGLRWDWEIPGPQMATVSSSSQGNT